MTKAGCASGFSIEVIESKSSHRSAVRSSGWLGLLLFIRGDDGSPLFNRAFVDLPLPATLASREADVDRSPDWSSRLDVDTVISCGVNGQNHFRHVGTGGDELVNLSDVVCGNRRCVWAHNGRRARRKKRSE